jgi:hypothetical protein
MGLGYPLTVLVRRGDGLRAGSLGLRTAVSPSVTDRGMNHMGIITGKLNGVITAKTLSGYLTVYMSIPGSA